MAEDLVLLILSVCLLALTSGQTVGGNSNGKPCHFPFLYEGRLYTTCIDINHDKDWCSTTPDFDSRHLWGECLPVDLADLPNFDQSTPQNVTVYQGDDAKLHCTINNLQGKTTSWSREGTRYPLTAGEFVFISTGKYTVDHKPADSEWNLIIHQTRKNDSGTYLCRVVSQTRLQMRPVHLTVKDPPPTVSPEVSLGDAPVVYVNKGEELKLQCNSTGRYKVPITPSRQVVPPEVEWFRGDGSKIDSHSVNKIIITNRVEGTLRISTLVIEKTDSEDGGAYICRNTDEVTAEVTVRVLNVGRDNKKRGTANEASSNTLGQVGGENSSTAVVVSTSLLILSLLTYEMT